MVTSRPRLPRWVRPPDPARCPGHDDGPPASDRPGRRWPVVTLVILALAVRLGMALAIPPWQGPDEPKHFEYVRLLVERRSELWAERRLPRLADASPELQQQIIASMARHGFFRFATLDPATASPPDPLPASFSELWQGKGTQLHRPSLYYLVGAGALLPFERADLETQLLAVRVASALISAAVVIVTYRIGRELAPGDPLIPVVAAAFVAFLPMHAFVGGTVNNDNLLSLVGSVIIWGIAGGCRRGFGLRRWAFILGALGLGIATKRGIVGLIPVICLVGALSIVAERRTLRLAGLAVGGLVAVGGLALVARGDQGEAGQLLVGARAALAEYALNEPDQLERLLNVPLGPTTYQIVLGHLDALFKGFWGYFGWWRLPLGPSVYQALGVASALALVGAIGWLGARFGAWVRHPTRAGAAEPLIGMAFLAATASMAVLAVGERLAYYAPGEVPQGRYLFVAIAAIGALVAAGLRMYLPPRCCGTALPSTLIVAALLGLDLHVYASYIRPFYGTG